MCHRDIAAVARPDVTMRACKHDFCLFVVSAAFKTQCQQELDQVLERISKMPFRDNRGPLEDLYALHIPNCDKRGQYNLKQVTPGILGRRVVSREGVAT